MGVVDAIRDGDKRPSKLWQPHEPVVEGSRRPEGWIRPMTVTTVSEALEAFSAPNDSSGKIQLLRPFRVSSKHYYSSLASPPIGVAYLGAALEAAGYDVGIIDALGEGINRHEISGDGKSVTQGLTTQEILDRINPETRILGVSLMFSQEWPNHRKLIVDIRERFPELIIVVGGEHPNAIPEFVLDSCPAIDIVVLGEGELSFLELVHRLLTDGEFSDVPGIAYRGEEGAVTRSSQSRRIHDFSSLPRPAWNLVDVEPYFNGGGTAGLSRGRNMPIIATRGCPYQCTFCSNPRMWTTRYLMREPIDVVNEIEWLVATYGATSIEFFDLTAIVKRDWIRAFCRELSLRDLGITWQLPSGTRSEVLDLETLRAIHASGCEFLVYAPESGSPRTLDRIKKRLSLDNIRESIIHANQIGLHTKINIVIGFPDETRFEILKTIKFVFRMAADGVSDCNISTFTPYPGSELFEEARSSGEIANLNDDYFQGLFQQFDATILGGGWKTVSARELRLHRLFGMLGFYFLSYLTRPIKLVNLLRFVSKLRLEPQNILEQRFRDFLARNARKKQSA